MNSIGPAFAYLTGLVDEHPQMSHHDKQMVDLLYHRFLKAGSAWVIVADFFDQGKATESQLEQAYVLMNTAWNTYIQFMKGKENGI